MSAVKKGSPIKHKAGGIGRFVFCPRSNTKAAQHGLVAKEIQKSAKGNLWVRCGCGFRGHFDYQAEDHSKEGFSFEEVTAAGALVSM